MQPDKKIAILIPCFNEAATLMTVIGEFKKQLPDSVIFVYDNNSTDNSVELALACGATVKKVNLRGKGQVVKRMFADIDADIYVMVDGDATYDPVQVTKAIALLENDNLDMVVCTRDSHDKKSFRPGHVWGNKCFSWLVNNMFGQKFTDIFSGYRIFSRRFVKSFPVVSHGFEIETEITIHALQLHLSCAEIKTFYKKRHHETTSKLRTFTDGFFILRTITLLFLYFRPMILFGSLFFIFFVTSMLLGFNLLLNSMLSHITPSTPGFITFVTTGLLAALFLICGIILGSINRLRQEIKRYWYSTV